MTEERRAFGRRAEEEAAKHLEKNGYRIVERNHRNALGEIDLVAEKDGCLVFVEVKAGKADAAFNPADHLDFRKKRKLLQLAQAYLARFKTPRDARVDLVTVVETAGRIEVDHFENVVEDAGL